MAIPIHLLNDPPHESSDEELSDSEVSYSSGNDSMDDEPSESENTNEGSRSCLSSLERKETDTEKEFWHKYPFIKMMMSILTVQGISEHYAYERAKLIGDDKAKELNDAGRALFLEELEIRKKKLTLIASALSLNVSGI